MKSISAALAQHLVGEVKTLATCWKITRGVTCRAASGYTRTAIREAADLAVDSLDVESVFSDDGITEEGVPRQL